MDSYRFIRTYVEVVNCGSLNKAAKKLGVGKSAVSKQLSSLEQELGVVLVKRTTRSLSLTPEGERFFEDCTHILDMMEEARERLYKPQSKDNLVRLGFSALLPRQQIQDMILSFMLKHSDVSFSIGSFSHLSESTHKDYDFLICLDESVRDTSFITQSLGFIQFNAITSKKYVQNRPYLRSPELIDPSDCIAFQAGVEKASWCFWRKVQAPLAAPCVVDFEPTFVTTDVLMLRDFIASGMGIAYVPEGLFTGEDAKWMFGLFKEFSGVRKSVHLSYSAEQGVSPLQNEILSHMCKFFYKEESLDSQTFNSEPPLQLPRSPSHRA